VFKQCCLANAFVFFFEQNLAIAMSFSKGAQNGCSNYEALFNVVCDI
jgi:hypothetical protein